MQPFRFESRPLTPLLALPLLLALLLLMAVPVCALCDDPAVLEISKDTVLDPARTYGRIVIKASNITIDGRGAWLIGSRQGNSKDFAGTAVLAENVSHVKLIHINAKGWETGLVVRDGSRWTVEACNFSDNFHDPSFGWGENGRRGGMLFQRVSDSLVHGCQANRVWDACVLVDCHNNRLEDNDFSHTSNTCLKLWNSTRNKVVGNNLSFGIRKKPGEVHARDSTCVLIESGANDNRFIRNDCSHGGDGIFIRVLNGWVSTGNVFEENDCSFANNNCVEAWSPRNTYVRNKANHGSYGFWLGASDQTVLIGNEASFNGLPEGNHNSPHLPDNGHAGIVFMFGPSSHTVVRDNTCAGNHGAGIALIGDQQSQGQQWRAYHWIIEQNRLVKNRWGIYMQYADWVDLAANRFDENEVDNIHNAGNVSRLTVHRDRPSITKPPVARLVGPTTAVVGKLVRWDASTSFDPAGLPLTFQWDLGDGATSGQAKVEHVFRQPGFYRLGLTVNNGLLSDLAWRDVYVTDDLAETGTEGQVDRWSWIDPASKCRFQTDSDVRLCGSQSLRSQVQPYGGGRVTLVYRTHGEDISLLGCKRLAFWLKTRNENVPAWQGENPIVTLVDAAGRKLLFTPAGDFLSRPPYNEARDGWTYFVVPLAGSAAWKRSGDEIAAVREVRFGFDSWGAPPLVIWLDGLTIH